MPPNPPPRRPAGPVRAALLRTARRAAASPVFARLAPPVLPRLDRLLHRLTGGRVQIARWAVPSLMLTTTGQRSGAPRSAPVACLPERERTPRTFLVVGSNFGREKHPAWTGNLLAHPDAVANYRGTDIPVRGVLITGEEREAAWARLNEMWPYESYASRSGREPRVFRLVPRDP
ncbi:nitroreductase family deazaflavin-dependent oxidoreductase [Nocardiopsis sp. RSe5-2]|uniref:Nitroreductase family deazaflavin-dependent oxidoreductase n=1 Tax=Nocardiopsis endophytica TaxID=3018445 RepID=A0ABT4UF43_9ACTN|nr:nitroreductase family deazaflavin-dependent oxidoreductase [Nocardiopsis endophytica]MDA2814962.1 nitroreductase family deazaflavin-dependent oxidoreductase [Nocardiopsis endophytica]